VTAALYRALFDTAPDAMIVVARDGRIVLANPQAARLFDWPLAELVGLPVERLMPDEVRHAHVAQRAGYMERPRVRPMGAGKELVGRRRDGSRFPVEIALSPVADGDETLFAASIRDISETQRQRQALVRARHDAAIGRLGQLAFESADFDALADSAMALVAETLGATAAGVALARPPHDELAACAMHGVTPALFDALCRRLSANFATAHDLAAVVSDADLAGLFRDAGIGGGRCVPLVDAARPAGALVVLTHDAPRFDRDAEHFLALVAHILATAALRHHAQEQLAHAQRLEAVGQLTGGIAHDFNNLLTVISGNLQLLEAELAGDADASDTIARALRAVGRGAELTRKLLAFARRQRLSPRAVDPQRLLADLGAMLERTLGEPIRLHVACADDVPPAYADPAQLEAALINLALNARDAMPRGGRLEIGANARTIAQDDAGDVPPGRYVAFTVVDTGLGMAPDVLARAFEPFFTTKETGKGSGLGLPMVWGFVRQSGGKLAVDSRLGYGTRIDLMLPVAPDAASTATATTSNAQLRGDETVLVVEDEPEVRAIATKFLASLGYRVHAARDADEALHLLRATPDVRLLFSDVMLGAGATGVELAQAALAEHPALAVLLTSGDERASADDAAGAFALLRKPYRIEELARAVREALERSN
jgi:PAS domain S-box-containing protein